jgi:hypothetical protein
VKSHRGWRLIARKGFPLGALARVLQDAESVCGRGDPRALKLAPGSRVTAHRCQLAGKPYDLCVKAYPYRGLRHALRWSAKTSRARSFWKGCWGLRARGFHVPDPYLMWEQRRLGFLLVTCGVVTERVRGASALDRYVEGATARERRQVLTAMARTLRRMHDKEIFHGDLKAGNVLVRGGSGRPEVVLLDLDAVRFRRRLSWHQRALNLAQLDASLSPAVGPRDRLRFLATYGRGQGNRGPLRILAREVMRLSALRRDDHR